MIPFYEFRPDDITVIHNTRELKYRSHIHKEIELIYIFEIGQHLNIAGRDFELHAGQAAVIFPNTVHTYYRNEWRNTDQIFVIFPAKLFGKLLPDLSGLTPQDPIITEVDDTVKAAFAELLSCDDINERIAWTLLITSRLMKQITLVHAEAAPVQDLTQKIIGYISANFLESITLDTLAKEFSVSRYYISHTFSDRLKISLPSYLSLIRAEYAAGLIRTTTDSITTICNKSGFTSQSTFNRAFKRIYCMTPREYKSNIDILYKNNKQRGSQKNEQ